MCVGCVALPAWPDASWPSHALPNPMACSEWGDFNSPLLPTCDEDIWIDCSSTHPGGCDRRVAAALNSAHDAGMQCGFHGTNRVPCMPMPATPPGLINLLPARARTTGRSLFEKQISGLFLGELARRMLLRCGAECAATCAAGHWMEHAGRRCSPCTPATTSTACATELLPQYAHLCRLAEKERLFGGSSAPGLLAQHNKFSTADMAACDEDDSQDLREVAAVLERVLEIRGTTRQQRATVGGAGRRSLEGCCCRGDVVGHGTTYLGRSVAWHGLGTDQLRHGMAWHGMAWHGMA